MQSEIFLKITIIFLMSIFIFVIAISTVMFDITDYGEQAVSLHKSVGIIFFIILAMHIYLRKKKLKKMILDIFDELTNKKPYECKNQKLLKSLKQRTFHEICESLNINIDNTLSLLSQKDVYLVSNHETLEDIAVYNSHNSLKIFAMILENHIRTLEKV